jgi:hypothetical protein
LRGEGAIEIGRRSHKNSSDYAGASEKISSPLTQGGHENCPTFFPITWPNCTEFAGFLALEPLKLRSSFYFLPYSDSTFFQSFCAVERKYRTWMRSGANAALSSR